MKKQLSGFFAGVLTATLIFSLALSALAISGRMTIDVDPINIQVNGETFAPTDVTGKEVPVFAYEGTTYAPLRALAEAYGLEVGYDAEANMASVTDPDVKPVDTPAPDTTTNNIQITFNYSYEEFKGLWNGWDGNVYFFVANNEDAALWWNSAPDGVAQEYANRLIAEVPHEYHAFANDVGEILYKDYQ